MRFLVAIPRFLFGWWSLNMLFLFLGHRSIATIRPCHAWTTASLQRSSSTARFLSQQQASGTKLHYSASQSWRSSSTSTTKLGMSTFATPATTVQRSEDGATPMINLHTIPLEDLEAILSSWNHPKYRAKQIINWVRVQGAATIDEMNNIPKALKELLKQHATIGALKLDCELISKDGTIKRAYRLADGQLIESVLMPYEDGRYTACISSQAGCAQGCVFCATGQMGFSRQLTPEEILEQVSRFASELAAQEKQLRKEEEESVGKGGGKSKKGGGSSTKKTHGRSTRLSNIVFMGMGEPLANYRNVKTAVQRIHDELGIGHRKITISTVGIVPNIAKLAVDLPQVRLAVSLHCANDEERTALLPANKRNGGLKELMATLQQYIETTGKRITLEWALIEGENDTPETAHQLGKLVHQWLRKDMVHVNVIPLNPTGGYGGSPSGRKRVDAFCRVLEDHYQVACTPRVRRGIDINAGCGQLKSEIEKRERDQQKRSLNDESTNIVIAPVMDTTDNDDDDVDPTSNRLLLVEEQDPNIMVYEDDDDDDDDSVIVMDDDDMDWEDYEYETEEELAEANRLIALVQGTTITPYNFLVGAPKIVVDKDTPSP